MRRRISKVGFNSKLIIDVIGAGLMVQQFPKILSSIIPLEPMLQTIAGVGGGYVLGMFLKHPELSNASIALGAIDLISPMVDNLLGSGTPIPVSGVPAAVTNAAAHSYNPLNRVADYVSLNDYISDPSVKQDFPEYRDSY